MKRKALIITLVSLLLALNIQAQKIEKPRILNRKEWGAKNPNKALFDYEYEDYGTRPSKTKSITLHNTSMGLENGKEAIKKIQSYEMEKMGFDDVGYNFLIDSAGVIYEGRLQYFIPSHAGQTEEANRLDDITLDPDFNNIGIAFIADSHKPLTEKQIDSAIKLISYLQSIYNITKVRTHAEIKQELIGKGLTPIGGYNPRICPGDGCIENIIKIREAVDPNFDKKKYRSLFN